MSFVSRRLKRRRSYLSLPCLVLVGMILAHDQAMVASGRHLDVATVDGAQPAHSHAHAHHQEPVVQAQDEDPHTLVAACDEARATPRMQRPNDDTPPPVMAIVTTAVHGETGAVRAPDLDGADWLVRDPHAQRALWQVYRI